MDDDIKKYDDKKNGEYDPELVVDAMPAPDNGPPIPPGHRRFYCEKCRAVRVTKMSSNSRNIVRLPSFGACTELRVGLLMI